MTSSTPSNKRRLPLNEMENLLVGAAGGALETTVQMPLITWKFTIQEGRPLPTHLNGWFRGVFAQASSLAPITALQVMASGVFGRIMRGGEIRELTNGEQMIAATGAGIVSALIYGPADLITIQQQKLVLGPGETIKHIYPKYGFANGIMRGFCACAVRESIYTAGYLGVAPIITKSIAANSDMSELSATIVGSCIAGTGAALLTHPVDTVKTLVQSDLARKTWPTARMALPVVYNKGGVRQLYKGAIPRTWRLCGAFFILSYLREFVVQWKSS